MTVKKIKMLTEEERNVSGVIFSNSTEDQFPYVEAALNSIDNNFNWWKENWLALEQLIAQQLNIAANDNEQKGQVSISSRFTVFHGHDEKDPKIIWNGPAIVYSIKGTTPTVVMAVKQAFGGIYNAHKMIANNNDLIILFG